MELYDDADVCRIIECDIIKNSFPLSFMNNDEKYFGNDEYHKKYREYMYDYLFHNKSLPDVLKKIEDITKIYTFSLKTDDSYIGLIMFFMLILLFTSTIISLVFVFIKTLENRFRFLSKNLWVITTLGSLILMSSIVTLYGEVSNAKCHLRVTLINVGFILSICPSLLKLISNFPQFNKISNWFEKNKYVAIIIIMTLTVGLSKIFSISSYSLQDIDMTNKGHYIKCNMKSTFGIIVHCIILIYDFFIIFLSLALIFMEWNLEDTKLDIRYLATALFMDTLSLIFLIIIDKVKFDDYILYNVFLAVIILMFSISNHIFIYFVRILPMFRPDSDYEDPRKLLGKLSSSSIADSKKRSIGSSSDNKSSSNNKISGGYYSNLANSPYNNMGTSFYNNGSSSTPNHMRTPSSSSQSHKRTQSSSSQGHTRTQSSSSRGHTRNQSSSSQNHMRNISYSKPTVPSLLFSKPPSPSILYSNPSTAITSSYTIPSSNGYNIPKSNSYSGYNDNRNVGIIRKIMKCHNQTEISYN